MTYDISAQLQATGKSVHELSMLSGVSEIGLGRHYNGKAKAGVCVIRKITTALNMSASDFLGFDPCFKSHDLDCSPVPPKKQAGIAGVLRILGGNYLNSPFSHNDFAPHPANKNSLPFFRNGQSISKHTVR